MTGLIAAVALTFGTAVSEVRQRYCRWRSRHPDRTERLLARVRFEDEMDREAARRQDSSEEKGGPGAAP